VSLHACHAKQLARWTAVVAGGVPAAMVSSSCEVVSSTSGRAVLLHVMTMSRQPVTGTDVFVRLGPDVNVVVDSLDSTNFRYCLAATIGCAPAIVKHAVYAHAMPISIDVCRPFDLCNVYAMGI
jgi:hypothetical protein